MDWAPLIVPTGILSFALFLFAMVNGFPRFRIFRYHAVTGYACLLVVLVHGAAALMSHIFEPLGVLAAVGMAATALSGRFIRKRRLHIGLAVITLLFSLLHVGLLLLVA